jgi:hypothetical protein
VLRPRAAEHVGSHFRLPARPAQTTRPELSDRSLATRTGSAMLTTQIRWSTKAGPVRALLGAQLSNVACAPVGPTRTLERGGYWAFRAPPQSCCQAASVVVTVRVWSAKLATSSRCPPSAWT